MFEFFENLRARPIRERQKYAWIISLSVTGIILALWIIFFSVTQADPEVKIADTPEAIPKGRSIGESFSIFADNFSKMYSNTKTQFEGFASVFKNASSTEEK